MTHTLICGIDGLVIARHNEIRDKTLYLSWCAFTSAYVRVDPLIHQGSTKKDQEICQCSDKHKDTREGVMIQGLWDCQVDAIIDIKVGDVDADTYKYDPMTSLLARWENIKNYKHGNHCHEQRKRFSSFFLSVDIMIGKKARVVLYQLSQIIADNREEPLSQVQGWVTDSSQLPLQVPTHG